jgi:peptidoglycan/LPS O-acetylase OafA/YrhL
LEGRTGRHEMQGRELPYMPQLDGLRAFAVGGVMLAHLYGLKRLPFGLSRFDWANAGVELFFVLSGFLITSILLGYRAGAEGGAHTRAEYTRHFYIRRALRIFPLYYLVVFVGLALDLPPAREAIGWLLTYTANYYITYQRDWMGAMGHFWSLAVEEQFYLVWPWLVLFVPRRWLLALSIALIALGPLYRLFALYAYPEDIWSGHFLTFTHTFARLDALGAGSLLAMALYAPHSRTRIYQFLNRLLLPAGVLTGVALYALNVQGMLRGAYVVLFDLALVVVLSWLVAMASKGFSGWIGRLLELRPLVYIGRISYGLYVYHNFMPLLLSAIMARFGMIYPGQGARAFVLASVATLAVASLSWHVLERPINRLKAHVRLKPRPVTTVTAPLQGGGLGAETVHGQLSD